MTSDPSEFLWHVSQARYGWVQGKGARPASSAAPEAVLIPSPVPGPSPSRVKRYAPFRSVPGLFLDFAYAWRTLGGVKRFADAYGLLGKGVQIHVVREGSRQPELVTGEPLQLWQKEITAMRQPLALWEAYRQGDGKRLAHHIHWEKDADSNDVVRYRSNPGNPEDLVDPDALAHLHPDHFDVDPETGESVDVSSFETTAVITSKDFHPEVLARLRPGDIFQPALVQVQRRVNEHLQGLAPPTLVYDLEQDRLVLQFIPDNLLDAMWVQFAQAIDENKSFHRCRGCQKWFEVKAGGMRTTRFHCSNACRVRAHRERQEQARRLHGEGKTFREIAKELDSDVATVKKWISNQKE